MSIIVENLVKEYGAQKALNGVSFEAPKGKITGFLGPNGAGKSTTMKIAMGYVSPTSGTVHVSGADVIENPLQVKRVTGYLPEHNPLYLDMFVKEYLRFVAKAYQLKNTATRIDEVIQLCGLELEQAKRINALSKGYRQRVGLAQALIHDPEVLILDEPTSGLDPNQLVEIRKVIKEVSQEKTVILSTHIMQEVEALCDKAVIINRGNIVADDEVGNLKMTDSNVVAYHVEFEAPIDIALFTKENLTVSELGSNSYEFSGTEDPRKVIMKIAGDHELPLLNISKQEKSLEGIFQDLTNA